MMALVIGGVAGAVILACVLAYGSFAPIFSRYKQLYTQAAGHQLGEVFLFLNPRQLWTATLMGCGAMAVLAYVVTASVMVAVIMGILPIRLPNFLMASLRRRRQRRFDNQLPDMLLALAASLRAGVSLPGALRQIVEQCEAPLSQEFGLMLREQRLGLSFEAALVNLQTRIATEAIGVVVAALRIALRTGGNLSETLESIAQVLLGRLQLLSRIQTLTAQGRLQAWVVGALAPLLAAVLTVLAPASMAMLWSTPVGWSALGLIVGLETAGILWIRRIVNIAI
jgi:tight adherence protein B